MTFKYIDKIDLYQSGQMTESEKNTFEKRLSTDVELKKELQDFQKIGKGVSIFLNNIYQKSEEEILREKLQKASLEYHQKREQNPTPIPRIIPLRALAIAASLVVLIGAGLFYLSNVPPDFNEIAAGSFDSQLPQIKELILQDKESLNGNPLDPESFWRKDYLDLVESKNLSKAEILLQQNLPESGLFEEEDAFLQGYNYYLSGDYETAISELEKFSRNRDYPKPLRYHADWLSALSYFQTEQLEKAAATAKKVQDDKQIFLLKQSATDLILLIESIE